MKTKLYQKFAYLVSARLNCIKRDNEEGRMKYSDSIMELCKDAMPSGSGVDAGTKFDFDRSTCDKLIFTFGFHHMNDGGYYDGWTEHTAILTASLQFGYNLRITGRDRNQVKEYMYEIYSHALTQEVEN